MTKTWKVMTDNKMVIFTILSTLFIAYQAIQNNVKNTANEARNLAVEAQLRELRQQSNHAAETSFALKLSGTKQTAQITENAMLGYYKQNLEFLEHCKKVRTCNLPTYLAVVQPLPNYVPIAAIYLQDQPKEKD